MRKKFITNVQIRTLGSESCKYSIVYEHHENRNDTDDVTPANGDGKGINAHKNFMIYKKKFMIKTSAVKFTKMRYGVVHQTDCVVHAVLGFLLRTGDSSGGGISGGAVLGTQRNSQ